jgi:hypothetical protein
MHLFIFLIILALMVGLLGPGFFRRWLIRSLAMRGRAGLPWHTEGAGR